MKLGKRLEAVASFVCSEGKIIDVGSNHGYLCIYFALQNSKRKIIATDCNVKSLQVAQHNIKKYHVENRIDVVVADGLHGIDFQATDNVVIAGMGTRTIKSILTKEVLSKGEHFIIQSNNYLYELRSYMNHHGFILRDEKVALEHQKYYVVMDFVKGNHDYTELELKYGPCLMKQKEDDYFDDLYQRQLYHFHKIPKDQLTRIEEQKKELLALKKIREML